MYDYSKLKGKITEKFTCQGMFSKAMGLSEHTLSRKLTNKIDWRQDEIRLACVLLGIPQTDVGTYFFAEVVHNCEHGAVT